jgi:hypothetical protein
MTTSNSNSPPAVLVRGALDDASIWRPVIPPVLHSTAARCRRLFGQGFKAGRSGRRNWYVISADDRAVSVEPQWDATRKARKARKLQARTAELEASQISTLSQPEAVAEAAAGRASAKKDAEP